MQLWSYSAGRYDKPFLRHCITRTVFQISARISTEQSSRFPDQCSKAESEADDDPMWWNVYNYQGQRLRMQYPRSHRRRR